MAQADSDHHVKDTYNYVTIQTDVKMPARQIEYLQDPQRHRPFVKAVEAAVGKLLTEDKDVRMLHLGAGAGECLLCKPLSLKIASKGGACPVFLPAT